MQLRAGFNSTVKENDRSVVQTDVSTCTPFTQVKNRLASVVPL